jgi:hypothetical protein
MDNWKPASKDEVLSILKKQCLSLSSKEREFLDTYRIDPRPVEIDSFGTAEQVFVIAELPDGRCIYYEDVEDGFEVASLNNSGQIPERGANLRSHM